MISLSLSLLGVFQASLNGQPITEFYSSKVRALLAYLAVEAVQHPRPVLAALLWPEWDDRAALGNLRFSLSKLRQAIKDQDALPPFLLISRDTIQLNSAADVSVDVDLFQQELQASQWESVDVDGQPEPAVRAVLDHLGAAMKLYRGRFLEGFFLADSAEFEQWALIKRQELEREACWALHGLTALYYRLGDYATAERYVRQLLDRDRWDELANRRLMAVLVQGGQRNAALRHYTAYQEELARELGCKPEDETQALYAQIRDGALVQPRPPRKEGGTETRRGRETEPPASRFAHQSPRSLPPEAQGSFRFVAREQELARLSTLLERALTGQGGVALIAGEAGSGKTALLDEFSRRAGLVHRDLIAARGSCNAYAGAGDFYLPFREMLQTLAGDVEGKRAGGTLSLDQARRAWEALPAVGAALVEYGPGLIDTFVPGEALLRRIEAFPAVPGAGRWLPQLQNLVRRAREQGGPSAGWATPAPGPGRGLTPQPDLCAQVTQVLHAVSIARPLLLAVDDLQWAGAGTAALLFHLGRRLAGSRILLVCAYRPEALAPRSGLGAGASEDVATLAPGHQSGLRAGVAAIVQELCREWGDVVIDLDRADGRAFVEAYVDSEPNRLETAFRQALYDHTGGNPLFAVELLRSFERAGALAQDEAGRWIEAAEPDWDHCPPRVEAVISGHLGGLPEEDRALLQAASVQGEQFVAEVAARVLDSSEEAAVRRLSGPLRTRHRLVHAVSVYRLAWSGQRLSQYRFRHLLVQASAYRGLDAVERARLHEATARALEALYAQGERPAGLAAELARHYEAAGVLLEAARALHEAGQQALRLSAYQQALGLFDRGLALLAHEPPSPPRAELEQLLEVARLVPQRNLNGMGGAKFEDALQRAKEAGAGDAQGGTMFQVLAAEAEDLGATGRTEEALAVAARMHDEAAQRGEEAFLAIAHWRLGAIHSALGHLDEGERHFEWLLTWLTPKKWATLRSLAGHDFTAACLAFSAVNRWFLGHPEMALARATEAMTGSVARGETMGQAFAFGYGAAALFLVRVAEAEMAAPVEYLHRLTQQEGFGLWQLYTDVFVGRMITLRGDRDRLTGLRRMQTALARWLGAGFVPDADILTTVLADTCLTAAARLGPGDEAARGELLAGGLAAIATLLGPEHVPCGPHWAAELHRLRGELLIVRGGLAAAGDALACFQTALALAQEHGLPSVELRVAMSLVRLREREGEACVAELAEACSCLRQVYERFAEGFAFRDLQDAAALIGISP